MQKDTDHTDRPRLDVRLARLIDLLQLVARQSRIILSVTMAGVVLGLVVSLILPRIYTAKTMLLPAQDDKGFASALLAQFGGAAALAGGGLTVGIPSSVELYVSMLRSEAIKDPIIDRFRLMDVYKAKYRTDAYNALDDNAVISAGKKDGIITITVDDRDPQRAAAIANAYAEELGRLAVRLNVSGAGQNRSFLEERLAAAKADLATAEEKLKAFQARNKAVQMNAQAEAAIKGLSDIKAQLVAQEVQLATYRRQYTESSQEVKNLATSVRNLRAQLARMEGNDGDSAIPAIGSVPAIGQEYTRRMREFKIQESLVDLLTRQHELAKLSEAKDVAPLQVILKAKPPERKSRPSRMKIVLGFTVAAFLSSLLLAFACENFGRLSEEEHADWKNLLKMRHARVPWT